MFKFFFKVSLQMHLVARNTSAEMWPSGLQLLLTKEAHISAFLPSRWFWLELGHLSFSLGTYRGPILFSFNYQFILCVEHNSYRC